MSLLHPPGGPHLSKVKRVEIDFWSYPVSVEGEEFGVSDCK